ncbi:MAG: carbamoyl-phosphate synthase small subunit [Candidatus Methanomethylophilaceae archaeon]|nr:carbamoyl-phosphate synthase small subunit [Candidatus Methanomethylophilaceae archaeon]
MEDCSLVLEDGTVIRGAGFGHQDTVFGEVVFNTGMTGYQESLTDPSYRGQILIMAYPLIGNYGINDSFNQSDNVHVKGFVVRELCREPSMMYGGGSLNDYLRYAGVPGLHDVDTRELIIRIRQYGALRGVLTYEDHPEEMVDKVRSMPHPYESNLIAEVSPKMIITYREGKRFTVGLIDCGAKTSIINDLRSRYNVIRFPHDTPADVILDSGIDGALVSNGPGDPNHPEIKSTTIKTIRQVAESIPLMGICMGNQLTALAFGAKTYKMKFGHRGANQSVLYNGRVYITSQNHGYAVDPDSLRGTGLIADQFNINDGTIEGLKHEELPLFTTQYHPEASPGPWDTSFLFDRLGNMMEARQ